MPKEYIERAQLIAWLEEEKFKFEEGIDRGSDEDELDSEGAEIYDRGYLCAIDEALSIAHEVPVINPEDCSPEWISVDKRLPELIPCNAGTAYSEAVIVWTDNRKAMIAVWDGVDFLCAFDYWEAWGEKITHWMPLPEPPKGD